MIVMKTLATALFASILCAGCSHTVDGDAEPSAAADSHSPSVAPADLHSLRCRTPR